jgi:hypothetical protein
MTHVSLFVGAANSIKDTVTDLHISSSRDMSVKREMSALICAFSRLKKLELHGFAGPLGLEALWDANTGSSLTQVFIGDYPEGNDKLRETIEKAGPKAPSWRFSY